MRHVMTFHVACGLWPVDAVDAVTSAHLPFVFVWRGCTLLRRVCRTKTRPHPSHPSLSLLVTSRPRPPVLHPFHRPRRLALLRNPFFQKGGCQASTA